MQNSPCECYQPLLDPVHDQSFVASPFCLDSLVLLPEDRLMRWTVGDDCCVTCENKENIFFDHRLNVAMTPDALVSCNGNILADAL